MKIYLLCLATVVTGALLLLGCPTGPTDAPNRFFVDGANGNDDNSGASTAPLASIAEGIARAQDAGGEVIVAAGNYAGPVTLASAVDLRGGFDPDDWVQDPREIPTVIEGASRGFIGDGVSTVLVEGFDIDTTDAAKGVEESPNTVGISLHNAIDVTLRDNAISAGRGADGVYNAARAAQGLKGGDGGAGKNAYYCTLFEDPRPGGAAGEPPAGSNAHAGGAGGRGGAVAREYEGYRPGKDSPLSDSERGVGGEDSGDHGTDGIYGAKGSAGELAAPFGTLAEGDYVPANGGAGQAGNGAGGGGGGAGRNEIDLFPLLICGASGGGGGAGGGGGEGGDGGEGGGGSFGILLTDSTDIRIEDNRIMTAGGGDGAAGQTGGLRGLGGASGRPGQGVPDGSLGDAGQGGQGGLGGEGGRGGGGAGGASIGIAEDAASESLRSNNQFTLGPAGEYGGGATGEEPPIEAEYYKAQ
jgi:hypothetical protein